MKRSIVEFEHHNLKLTTIRLRERGLLRVNMKFMEGFSFKHQTLKFNQQRWGLQVTGLNMI